MTCLLGIDVSTTATKAVLVDEHGRTVAVASSTYDLSTPKPLWAEQDPLLCCTGDQGQLLDACPSTP